MYCSLVADESVDETYWYFLLLLYFLVLSI